MKRILSSLLFALLTLAGNVAMAQYANWPDEDVFDSDQERYGHLEYFGFFGSAMGGWDFTTELAPFTNLTWIQVGWLPDDPTAGIAVIVGRLEDARDAGVKAVLHIEPYLWLAAEGELKPDDDILDFLVELRAQVEAEDLLDTIAMIYPIDEPFRNLINLRDPSFVKEHVTGEAYTEIHVDLVHLNALIKLVFPEKPIGVILSGYRLHHRFFTIPENYDWVGFDCYQELFRSCDDKSFVEHYAQLLEHMQPHQRLFAVPETWAMNESLELSYWPDVLEARMKHHYEIALNEPRFIAIIPFIWSFDSDAETPGLGLNRFSELYDDGVANRGSAFVDLVIDIGLQIKEGAFRPPNMAPEQAENSVYRPESQIRGGVTGLSSRGVVSAWAFDDGFPHKNLRLRILVRDANGNLVHKSRMERTFIRDAALAEFLDDKEPVLGLHGYRYQLPRYVVDRGRHQDLNLELVIYSDGYPSQIGASYDLPFRTGKTPSRPETDRDGGKIRRYLD